MTILIKRLFVVTALIFAIGSIGVSGQVQAINGSIQGDVTDSAGAAVPGAAGEDNEVETGTIQSAVTDAAGHFEFLSLKPGRYVVKISKTGFATTIQQNLSLTVGRTISLKPTLQVAGASESIVVSAAPLVDIVPSASTSPLGEQTIATTPVLGRKFEDLLTLTPGVSIVQGPDGDEINFAGQRGIFNNVSFDGGGFKHG